MPPWRQIVYWDPQKPSRLALQLLGLIKDQLEPFHGPPHCSSKGGIPRESDVVTKSPTCGRNAQFPTQSPGQTPRFH